MALKHWIWLSMRSIRRDKLWQLCMRFDGARGVYDAQETELLKCVELTKDELNSIKQDRSLALAEKVEAECEKKKISVISFTDDVYPKRLRSIDSPPVILYARGNVNCLTADVPFGIVGTRKAAPNSLELTHKLSYMLAKAGFTIVSGMAAGVDSAAACGALDAGCKTIAVFGSGVDICYPKSNAKLMDAIIENGCVISENTPGTPPLPWTFPQRNRIIAGISSGVLVTAAPEKSGSIITATYAMEQGRDVYVVPGRPGDKEYAGSLALIKDGATMITEADDIIYDFGLVPVKIDKSYERILQLRRNTPDRRETSVKSEIKEKKQSERREVRKENKDLYKDRINEFSGEEKIIAEAILSGASQFDLIAEKTGLDTSELLSMLTMMELNGKIIQKPGKYYELII